MIETPTEKRTLLAALEMYGQACIAAIQAIGTNDDEDKRLEYACRYDEARTMAERVAGIA